jgi:hypothetical protein
MTRKLPCGLLLYFTVLTILPGCQNMPFFGKAAGEGPKEFPVHEQTRPAEVADTKYSTQDKHDVSTSLRDFPDAKLPKAPLLETGLTRPDAEKNKTRNEGVTGIVTLEPAVEPIGMQAPSPLPKLVENKREYAPLVEALQCMLDERHEEAIKHLRAYDDGTQQFFLRLLPPLTILVKKRIEDLTPQEVAVLIDQIDGLRISLLHRSELVVSKMCYCKQVKNYAYYEAMPDNHAFLAGTESRIGEQVQLYVELKNFESKQTKEGEFLTKLACSLELHDAGGKKVWSKRIDSSETTHRRRSRMNDFCSNYSFYVPALPPGTYQLTLNIADETNPERRRDAHKSLVFVTTPVANQPPLR